MTRIAPHIFEEKRCFVYCGPERCNCAAGTAGRFQPETPHMTTPAEALRDLEDACERVAAGRSQKAYDAMIEAGQADDLLNLDRARAAARAALTSPAPAPDVAGVVEHVRSIAERAPLISHERDWLLQAATLLTTLSATNERWQRQSREGWEAFSAMRNIINEVVPMQSAEADLLTGPEMSMSCEIVAKAVVQHVATLSAENARLVEALRLLHDAFIVAWGFEPSANSIHHEPLRKARAALKDSHND